MPEMPAGRRGSGGQITGAATDPDSLLPWLNGQWPPLKTPDQSRYGPPPGGHTQRKTRAPRWWLYVVDTKGRPLHDAVVIGQGRLTAELAEFEARADFGGAVTAPR